MVPGQQLRSIAGSEFPCAEQGVMDCSWQCVMDFVECSDNEYRQYCDAALVHYVQRYLGKLEQEPSISDSEALSDGMMNIIRLQLPTC